MANDLTRGNILVVDTLGLLSRGPIWIKGFEFVPANAGDAFTLLHYKLVTPITNSNVNVIATITSTTTLTDDSAAVNKLTAAAFPQFSLLRIKKSTGSTENTKNGGYFLITTAGNDDRLITSDAQWPLTNEASKNYDLEAYVGTVAYQLLSPSTDKQSVGRSFGDPGLRFDNLAISVLTAGAKLYLYL